ncbi:MAG: sugar ABC transporter permease [Sphaerochaetaceae bacterium]
MEEKTIQNKKRTLTINVRLRSFAMVGALIVIWLLFTLLTHGTFLSMRNISNLFRLTGIMGVLVIGMVGCLVSGVFDLSIGSVVGLTGAITGILLEQVGVNYILALFISLIFGLLIGMWQGFWIAYRGVPAFIVTLGGMMIFRGITVLITNGCSIPISNHQFAIFGQGYLPRWVSIVIGAIVVVLFIISDLSKRKKRLSYGFNISSALMAGIKYTVVLLFVALFVVSLNSYQGLPLAVVILIVLYFLFAFIYNKTKYGRYVYAVGGNQVAAKLSGINIKRIYMRVFMLMGLLSALGGNILTSRLATATPNAGNGFELDAIASCVIGGISLAGGRGQLFGAMVGTLVMTSLANGMSLMNMTAAWQDVVKGLILLFAVWFDVSYKK